MTATTCDPHIAQVFDGNLGQQMSDPGAAGNGPGSDRNPLEAPVSETVRDPLPVCEPDA